MNKRTFPHGFLWGSATASYQVEGGIDNNDWALAGQKGKVPKAGTGPDQYHRYKEDFDIAKSLGHKVHRISLEWSRIEPKSGSFNKEAIEHYRKVLNALKERGLETHVTLWHFTLPIWFVQKGGFESGEAHNYFRRYARYVIEMLGDLIDHVDTINEPIVFSSNGWLRGNWPPFKKNRLVKFILVSNHLAKAHICSYCAIKRFGYKGTVGVVKDDIYFHANANPFNKIAAIFMNWFWNRCFLNKIKNFTDTIGLNYYFHSYFGTGKEYPKTDFGWDIYPEGIYHTLIELKRYKKPIFISESGLADEKDTMRAQFIKDHLFQVWRAIQDGVDVRGYMYWSLIDNFEWAEGYDKKFGLVKWDEKTKEREIRPSAYEYKKICESNALEGLN